MHPWAPLMQESVAKSKDDSAGTQRLQPVEQSLCSLSTVTPTEWLKLFQHLAASMASGSAFKNKINIKQQALLDYGKQNSICLLSVPGLLSSSCVGTTTIYTFR